MRLKQAVLGTFAWMGEAALNASPARRAESRKREMNRPAGKTEWFTSGEKAAIVALAGLILPSDIDAPGANDIAGSGKSAHEWIEGWVASSPDRQKLYARGLVAFDEIAGGSFATLSGERQAQLLNQLEAIHSKPKTSRSEKVARKIEWVYGRLRGWGPAVELYPMLVNDVLMAFYSSEVAWKWLGYDGPPMPDGYVNPDVFRPQTSKPAPPSPVARPALPVARSTSPTDVVVVGSGAGGAVVAKELAQAGLNVVVIEAGRRYDPARDYATDVNDFEARAWGRFNSPEHEQRDRYTSGGGEFNYNRVKGVGGSTLQFQAMVPRLNESDFRVHSEDGVASDWPITYADLEPYYARVEYELGVSGPDGDNPFEPPRSRPYPTPPHPFNLAGKAVKRGADKLGWHMVREPLALPTRPWDNRPACVGAGACSLGCQISAKSSMDVTYLRTAEGTGRAEIRSECVASEIELDSAGRARAVVYFDATGTQHRVEARAVVVAGNAIETPRLLLLSTSGSFPNGLANSSGLVGTHFTEHLAVFSRADFAERVDPWRGTPTGGMIQDFCATRPTNGFARGWSILVSSSHSWPFSVAGRVGGRGKEHQRRMLETFGHQVCIASVGEQLPDARNRVALDPVEKDNFGMPVPRIINEPRENDRAMMEGIKKSHAELLSAAGATRTHGHWYAPGGSSHYLGTCRMGNDPATSVVDAWGRTHDVRNLFIADGSVFVTGGAVNSMLTISALASRIADGIIDAFRTDDL